MVLSGDLSPAEEEFLERKLRKRSELLLAIGLAREEQGLELALNFQTPLPPDCFHSWYDLRAMMQFTIRDDFPP